MGMSDADQFRQEFIQNFHAGRMSDAREWCELLLELNPCDEEALFIAGMTWIEERKTEPAASYFLRLFSANKAHPGSWYGLGRRSAIIAEREKLRLEAEIKAGIQVMDAKFVPAHRADAIRHYGKAIELAVVDERWHWIHDSAVKAESEEWVLLKQEDPTGAVQQALWSLTTPERRYAIP